MVTLTQASHQWATRPDDERFTNLLDFLAHTRAQREASDSRVISSRKVRAVPIEGDSRALAIQDADGQIMLPSHWAFGQFAARASSPASYLRQLPTPIAADCLNAMIRQRDVDEIGLLTRDDLGGGVAQTLAAATGPNYGRIFNADIAAQMVDRFGDGVSGDWRVPGEFGRPLGEVTKANTTIYAGDRDMFVFLADEVNRVEVPNRRNGQAGTLARGFFVWNSEVGSATLGIAGFFFDYACRNRTVWGVEQLKETRIRHTASAPDRFIEQVAPALQAYAESSAHGLEETIRNAQAKRLDDVEKFLGERFTNGQVRGIKLAHQEDEGRPIETLWDASVAVTAFARETAWQDDRVKLEREGGKILKLAV